MPLPIENLWNLVVLAMFVGLYWARPGRVWQNSVLFGLALAVLLRYSFAFLALVVLACLLEWVLAGIIRKTPNPRLRAVLFGSGLIVTLAELYVLHLPLVFPSISDHLLAWGIPTWISSAFMIGWPLLWALQKTNISIEAYERPESEQPGLFEGMLYAMFFTNLAFGPTEPLRTLSPQLARDRRFEWPFWESAAWQILLGFFKFRFILGMPVVRQGLGASAPQLLLELVLSLGYTWAFFSGMNNLIKGCAHLFAIEISDNFLAPFLAKDLADFWRRWNMSVYRWIYETIYSPLSFALRDWAGFGVATACIATFVASGILHGPKPGYLLWGILHGVGMTALLLTRSRSRRSRRGSFRSRWKSCLGWFATMSFVVLASQFEADLPWSEMLAKARILATSPWDLSIFADSRAWAVRIAFFVSIMGLQGLEYRANSTLWMLGWSAGAKVALGTFFVTAIVADWLVLRQIY